jgi:type IV conjugative transfer system protein TraE
MDIGTFNLNLKKLKSQRNYAFCLNVFLSLVTLLVLLILLKKSSSYATVIVPAGFSKELVVSSQGVNEGYLVEWAEFLTSLKLNISPNVVDEKQKSLLNYVDPTKYSAMKEHLFEEGEKVKNEDLSMTFYPTQTKVIDVKKMLVTIEGVLRVYVGNELNQTSKVIYNIGFNYNNGRLLLNSFSEVDRA